MLVELTNFSSFIGTQSKLQIVCTREILNNGGHDKFFTFFETQSKIIMIKSKLQTYVHEKS